MGSQMFFGITNVFSGVPLIPDWLWPFPSPCCDPFCMLSLPDVHLITCPESLPVNWRSSLHSHCLWFGKLRWLLTCNFANMPNTSKYFYSFIYRHRTYFQLELVSDVIARILSPVHVFCGLCVSSFTTTLWLTSCSICCRSIKQTDHINCMDSTEIWLLLRTRHISNTSHYCAHPLLANINAQYLLLHPA